MPYLYSQRAEAEASHRERVLARPEVPLALSTAAIPSRSVACNLGG